jgi:diguanylate cyclase (GGDEF)-like protein
MRRLSDLALQDGLTGVANRRCFDQRFQVEWQRSHRSQIPLSLLLIDIDHFKKLNDTHGHLAGDECLVQVARALRKAVSRPGDLLARYGGEEFVALLPETDAEGARNVALHMKALLDGAEPGVALCYPLTVSIGVATRQPPRAGSAALLLETADRAMYRAKQNGRNRIEVLPMRPPGSE